jgi:hypothetical protein
MKYLLMTSLVLFNMSAFANDKKMHQQMEKKIDKMSFEDAQKMKKDMLDQKATMIDDEKKCVNDAKDKSELKKCMQTGWEKHQNMKKEAKKDMKDTKDNNSSESSDKKM